MDSPEERTVTEDATTLLQWAYQATGDDTKTKSCTIEETAAGLGWDEARTYRVRSYLVESRLLKSFGGQGQYQITASGVRCVKKAAAMDAMEQQAKEKKRRIGFQPPEEGGLSNTATTNLLLIL